MLLNQILIISIFSNQSISIKILIQILILINIRCSGNENRKLSHENRALADENHALAEENRRLQRKEDEVKEQWEASQKFVNPA